jgi:hypothetical protein
MKLQKMSVPMPLSQRRAIDTRQVRFLRLVWAVMLFSLCLYAFALVVIHPSSAVPPDRTFQFALLMLGIVTGSVVLYLRFVRLPVLFSADGPTDENKLVVQFRLNYILCFVVSETTALFGFALAVMHGDLKIYLPLYLGGVLLMALCFPQFPSNE